MHSTESLSSDVIILDYEPTTKPAKGTSLFQGTKRSPNSYRLYQNNPDRWNDYSLGYKWALKVLLKQATTVGMHPNEDHYYPILFVFRQYLELRLKNLIINLNSYLGEKENYKGHKLKILWNNCHRLIIKFFSSGDNDLEEDPQIEADFYNDLKLIGKFILELNSIDEDAQSTRYPENKKQQPFFSPKNSPIIDVNHFSEIVNWIVPVLDIIQEMIDEQYQQRCAILDEMRSD
ncbi:MAG: hypothetical protein Q7T80_07390 [Methanoregula sp.]|nr:hypothetical protein [Methanoregula sp.]